MRQQLPDFTGPLCRQPRQHILEIGKLIISVHARQLDQAHDGRWQPSLKMIAPYIYNLC